jgi:hypothetical protein
MEIREKLATVDNRRLRSFQPGCKSQSCLQAVKLPRHVQHIHGNSQISYCRNKITIAFKQTDSARDVLFGQFFENRVSQPFSAATPQGAMHKSYFTAHAAALCNV